jgi:hypothetical protein
MPLTRFDAPAHLRDLDEDFLDEWSRYISRETDGSIIGNPAIFDGPRSQYFNELKNPVAPDAVVKVIAWTAFPRNLLISSASDKQRWRKGDADRHRQDEYCEWSVTRNAATKKITRVEFTCEDRVYWQKLAKRAPEKVLELYRQHVNPQVQMDDLFDANGNYQDINKWNNSTTRGAMHMIQGSNNISAAIELAAAATIVRKKDGQVLTDEQSLIKCGRYGEPTRNSDPFIGGQVNSLAREKHEIALANPIGVYMEPLQTAGWKTPDNENPAAFWKITRGTPEHALRAIFEVPVGKGYTVSDISINGNAIEFGSQIADFIRIRLTGVATRLGQSNAAAMSCRADASAFGDMHELESGLKTATLKRSEI